MLACVECLSKLPGNSRDSRARFSFLSGRTVSFWDGQISVITPYGKKDRKRSRNEKSVYLFHGDHSNACLGRKLSFIRDCGGHVPTRTRRLAMTLGPARTSRSNLVQNFATSASCGKCLCGPRLKPSAQHFPLGGVLFAFRVHPPCPRQCSAYSALTDRNSFNSFIYLIQLKFQICDLTQFQSISVTTSSAFEISHSPHSFKRY